MKKDILLVLLNLVLDPPLAMLDIQQWTPRQCKQAHEWAVAEHLFANDNNDVKRLPKPEWIR